MRFGLAHFLNGYSFLMISPNLLDFWAMFFLILSRYGTLHLLIVGPKVMAILCGAAKNSLRGTSIKKEKFKNLLLVEPMLRFFTEKITS
jgi:hypothetical protein